MHSAPSDTGPVAAMKHSLFRLSLAQQFLLLSFPILLAGTLVIGWWVGGQVQDSVVHRMGGVTALYVDSFVAPHVQGVVAGGELAPADIAEIAHLLANTPLGKKVVSLKVWRPDGRVLYSSDSSQIGKAFPIDDGLAAALGGTIFSEISDRSEAEREEHGQPLARAIETYTPIHADRHGNIIAAAEFYQAPDEVDREAGAAQRRSWLIVAGTMLGMYLLLFALVRRGSKTIVQQQHDLAGKVAELTSLNRLNSLLHERVRRAAGRTTTLNENFLQRLSADIHDGPGQDLGFALMRLKSVDEAGGDGAPGQPWLTENLVPVRVAVQAALTDLRAISADLQLPDIGHLTLIGLTERVLRDYENKTTVRVRFESSIPDVNSSMRVKITLYRLLQESLANAFHHAKGENCRVVLSGDAGRLVVEVKDDGHGFDAESAIRKGRLGLAGMRERVEVLGGTFVLETGRGNGTVIRATLPLLPGDQDDE
jgi:signal transduction histidine kinase